MYHYDALWLTQWNVNSMLGLAYPEVYSNFVKSQLQMYKDGGLLPRGPAAGEDTMVMTGSPVTSFITGAINKGITDFDVDLAYDAMLDAHSAGGLFDKGAFEDTGWSGTGGYKDYFTRGFVPQEIGGGPLHGGAGETLEYAHQDWALAQLAHKLGKRGWNVAQSATVTQSSGVGARVTDGRPERSGDIRWVPTDDAPWVQLDWAEAPRVTKVVVTDPGTLRFSDGTSVQVQPGETRVDKRSDWVRFEGDGPDRTRGLGRPRTSRVSGGALTQLAQPLRPVDRLHPAQEPRRLVDDAVRSACRPRTSSRPTRGRRPGSRRTT